MFIITIGINIKQAKISSIVISILNHHISDTWRIEKKNKSMLFILFLHIYYIFGHVLKFYPKLVLGHILNLDLLKYQSDKYSLYS